MNRAHAERVAESERDSFRLAKVGEPVPGEEALAADDEVAAAKWRQGVEQGIRSAGQIPVQDGLAGAIEHAQVHRPGVQIDATTELMATGVNSHAVPPLEGCWSTSKATAWVAPEEACMSFISFDRTRSAPATRFAGRQSCRAAQLQIREAVRSSVVLKGSPMSKSKRVLIWDLPTRIFHWLLAGGFLVAALLALAVDEDSPLFAYHAILGLIIAFMIVLRVFWGFVGTRYARLSSFAFGPRAVIEYMRGVLLRSGVRHIGHNPGSAWAIFVILGLAIGLAITGMMFGRAEEVEELHSVLAYAMIAVVATHILGVVLHTVRHRENIVASMIHGRKEVDAQEGIASSHRVVALVFVILTGAWAMGLFANHNAATQTTRLPLIGVSVQVGELEGDDKPDGREPDHDDD